MIALGGLYYMLPRVTGKPLYSSRLADVQYWLLVLGMAGFFMVLTAAGLVQGNAWLNGTTVYRTLPMLHIYFILRASIGVLIVGAAFIGLYNVIRTIRGEQAQDERILEEAFQGEPQ
jgi:cbb3-type cytochrome oxidase subunit 1